MPSRIEHIFENGIELKRCGKCHEYKSLSEFHKANNTWDGLYYACIKCFNNLRKENTRRRAVSCYRDICNRVLKDERYVKRNTKVEIAIEDFVEWYQNNWFPHCHVDRKCNQGDYEISNLQMLSQIQHNFKRRQDRLDFSDIVEPIGKRYCFTCSTMQPETEFYVKQRKISEGNPKGLDECCKTCCREKRREHYKKSRR